MNPITNNTETLLKAVKMVGLGVNLKRYLLMFHHQNTVQNCSKVEKSMYLRSEVAWQSYIHD